MSDCINLRFGHSNKVVDATLSADPSPETPLGNMKNEYASRLTVWPTTGSAGTIVITGSVSEPKYSEFIALPSAPLIGDAEIKVELFLSPATTTDLLVMPFTPMRRAEAADTQIPLGTWVAGVDPYNGADTDVGEVPETFVYWFGQRIYYDSFRLTIQRSSSSNEPLSNVRLRMLFMGEMVEMNNNFSFGHTISFVTPPSLTMTTGGSWVNTNRRLKNRQLSLSLDQMDGDDYRKLHYFESNLFSDPFIISAYASEAESYLFDNFNMLCRFRDELEFLRKYEDVYRTNITAVEV